MYKICRTCNEKKALNKDNWWVDNRYKDGWSTQCKRCSRIQMRKVADARMKEVHCVICNKLFPCYPDTSRRYRLTCGHEHQRQLISNNMLVRVGKRKHRFNFQPDGTPVLEPEQLEAARVKVSNNKKISFNPWCGVSTDFPALNDPF